MIEHYKKIKDLFEAKPETEYQKWNQIKDTINNLKKIKISKKYPDLKSKYIYLKEYSDKTIYMFSVTNFPYDKCMVRDEFDKLTSNLLNGKKISMCRINENSPEWGKVQKNEPVCLYVGSSKNIVQRLKEHLFLCNQNTYAMHLEKWFDPNMLNLPITIDMWDFHDFLEGENPEYLQIIEDLLWQNYKPLFGRQGKK